MARGAAVPAGAKGGGPFEGAAAGREPRELSPETRNRILEAAGEVFAEHGFGGATIRDIAARASANVASIHYHFGDKQGLYRATLLHAHRECRETPGGGIPETASPEERLHGFVSSFMRRILSNDRPAWHTRLMGREMIQPTGLIDELVREGMRPQLEILTAIVRRFLPAGAGDGEVHLAALSVIGQCVFYRHCAPVIEAFEKQTGIPRPPLEALVEHIAAFSRAALEGGAGGGRP